MIWLIPTTLILDFGSISMVQSSQLLTWSDYLIICAGLFLLFNKLYTYVGEKSQSLCRLCQSLDHHQLSHWMGRAGNFTVCWQICVINQLYDHICQIHPPFCIIFMFARITLDVKGYLITNIFGRLLCNSYATYWNLYC